MKVRLPKGVHPVLKALLAVALLFGLAGAGVFTYFYVYYSRIIDRRINGGAIFANTSRIYAAPTPVFLAIEDHTFFHHCEIDFLRTGKAAYDDLRGRPLSGASTLTMQVAGGYSHYSRDRSWRRKLPEILIALELEHRMSKKEILEFYL